MKSNKDKQILKTLIEKYGKKELNSYINEAFKSDILRSIDKSNKEKNERIRRAADDARNARVQRANKFHYDGEDGLDNQSAHEYLWGMDSRFKGKGDRDAYMRTTDDISRMYKRDLEKIKPNIKLLFNKYGANDIKWSEVTDNDFISLTPAAARKYTRDNYRDKFILFWIDKENGLYAITNGKVVAWTIKELDDWKHGSKVSDIASYGDALKVYVLRINGDNDPINGRVKQHGARELNRRDSIENTPQQNARIAAQNVERYKRIIAENNLTKFDSVDKDVRNMVKASGVYISQDDADLNVVVTLGTRIKEMLSYYSEFLRLKNYVGDKKQLWYSADELNNRLNSQKLKINDVIKVIKQLINE